MSGPLNIAIVGLAGCYAGARDVRAYWQNILDKVDAVADAPAEWIGPYLDPEHATQRNDRIYTARGGFLRDLAEVDPAEFGVMPSMADGGEPDHLLALKHARDALADAGYLTRPFNRQRAGVVLGRGTYANRGGANGLFHGLFVDQAMDIVRSLRPDLTEEDLEDLRAAFKKQLPPYSGEMVGPLTPNVITGMIANRLDLMGPNYLVDAACASSLIAVNQAVQELVSGRCDLMLTGGVHAHVPPQLYIQFCQINALAHGLLRPFSKGSDGTLLGEGVGVMVLKRLADAEADGDRIYAVIKGIGTSSDGKAKGLLTPRLEGEVLALKRAYESSGIDPATIGLIEAHGTGTPIGDATEIQALSTVFGPRSGELPTIALGTVKSMISHCLPASGAAAMIKTALALHHKVLPPTLCEEPDPALELERTPFYLNTETRPWIHGGPHPRRAGVNAFGFGGINAHVILEEYRRPQRARGPSLLAVPGREELVALSAESAPALIETLERLAARLRQNAPPSLAEVAKAAAAQAHGGSHRLALVCESEADLLTKLDQALAKLKAAASPAPFKTRSGIYYGHGNAPGRLCFLFPGEGSQYPNMLADLAIHFPPLREWFDFVEENAAATSPRAPVLFPPPTALTEEARQALTEKLYDMDVAAELVFAASLGLHAVLEDLGFQADAMLGHSTGENTALTVCGVRRYERREEIAESIRSLNRIYRRLLESGEIVQGVLLTVGALRPDARRRLLEDPAPMRLAMDNCPNQLVLFGSASEARALKEKLTAEGAVCAELPFDRPYHTPLFKPVANAYREHFATLDFGPGKAQLYSACSAAPFPDDPDAIRELAVAQWENPVRFVATVERLYADGVRVFVEVGPSGNLTSFVSDILRDKRDVIAVAVNSRRRPGLQQFHHMLAQLHAAGVAWQPERLYAHREIADVDLAALPRLPARPKLKLKLAMPSMRVPPDWKPKHAAAPAAARSETPGAAPDPVGKVVPLPRSAAPTAVQAPAAEGTSAPTVTVGTGSGGASVPTVAAHAAPAEDPRLQALKAHFALMQEFLDSQARVLAGLSGLAAHSATEATRAPDASGGSGSTASSGAPREMAPVTVTDHDQARYPLLGRIVELSPHKLVAERSFDLQDDLFLRDHCIGVAPSPRRPELLPLSCIPFTFSMEILAQAAARLAGGALKTVSVEHARGSRWLALDEGPLTLRIIAERAKQAHGLEQVQVRLFQIFPDHRPPQLRFEGLVALAERYPEAPAPHAWRGQNERPARNNPDAELYSRGMFHGPRLRGVRHIRRWADDAIEADLLTLPVDDYFGFTARPRFQTDAALLDAAGQLTAYWLTDKYDWNHACFPFHVGQYTQYRDPLPPGTPLVCRGALRLVPQEQRLQARFELIAPDGRMVARATGWESRTFLIPDALCKFRLDPVNRFLSRAWPQPAAPGEPWIVRADYFPEGLLDEAWGVWKRVLANMVLCASEREHFYHRLPAAGARREEWLMGRIAAKDAVRLWAKQKHGVQLAPADVEIASRDSGEPYLAACAGLPPGASLPSISISHSGRAALAACCDDGAIGLDYQRLGVAKVEDLVAGAFTEAERVRWLAALPSAERTRAAVALWCAKEAAAKAAGTGLKGRPQDWQTTAFERAHAPRARVCHEGREYEVQLRFTEDGEVLAWCRAPHLSRPGTASVAPVAAYAAPPSPA